MIEINIEQQALNCLPPRLRSYEMEGIALALNHPFKSVLTAFYEFYSAKRYEMAFTGQVIYLEHLLNDQFDNEQRRIRIADYVQGTPIYVFNKVENGEELLIYNKSENEEPLYLFNQSEGDFSFIIYVPQTEITNWNLFKTWVEKYKLKSKKYLIIEE